MPGFGQILSRGELLSPGNKVDLTIQYRDGSGQPIDADSIPQISLIQPSGSVLMSPTSAGVAQNDVGNYSFVFDIPIAGPYGIWNDLWVATIQGFRIQQTGSFIINYSDQPGHMPNSDGYIALGDDIGFNYSQTAIFNIDKCIKMMKAQLNSSGKAKQMDSSGNVVFVDCDIFSTNMLTTFIAMSLSKFNSIPYFTYFTFEDSDFFAQFAAIIAEGAVICALASQALIERGREFTLTDNGINFNPPSVSELLNTQFNTMLSNHWESLRMIKASMRPNPLSLGMWSIGGSNPALRRLRTLKARQII